MRRILTIAAFFTAALGIAALSAQPSHAGHKGHAKTADSHFSVTYSYGPGYASGHKTRIYPGFRHGQRYSRRFRHHHQAARHDRIALAAPYHGVDTRINPDWRFDMRRILTIAAFFTATLGIAALSAQPSYAGHKGHANGGLAFFGNLLLWAGLRLRP